MDNASITLVPEEVEKTIERLQVRIRERFPGSGLAEVSQKLLNVSKETSKIIAWIDKPNYLLRIIVYTLIVLFSVGVIHSMARLHVSADGINIADVVQMIDSALSGLVLIGAGVVFLVTFENKTKRNRIVKAINQLRCIAHIIDSHQLTKDPDRITRICMSTPNSPRQELSRYDLGRYLNYCSEMLSLAGKLGFLYVQNFPDPHRQ